MHEQEDFIFIGGCARSGTTALCELMNAHRDVLIGQERYFRLWRRSELGPQHFTIERFMAMEEADTHSGVRNQLDDVPEAKRTRTDLRLGDKFPPIYEVYEQIWQSFPNARVLYIVRDPRYVALSYQKRKEDPNDKFRWSGRHAVSDWNTSVRSTLAAIQEGRPITLVSYDRIFASIEAARLLFSEFGLDPDATDDAYLSSLVSRGRTLEKALPRHMLSKAGCLRSYVELMADWKAYKVLTQRHCLLSKEHKTPAWLATPGANVSTIERAIQ